VYRLDNLIETIIADLFMASSLDEGCQSQQITDWRESIKEEFWALKDVADGREGINFPAKAASFFASKKHRL